jgi:hypothetical protein
MTPPQVDRDERTTAVENAGYRLSHVVLTVGLLVEVAFRSFRQGQNSWDLLALVVLGGVVSASYQGLHQVLYKRWILITALTIVTAALLAIAMTMLRH